MRIRGEVVALVLVVAFLAAMMALSHREDVGSSAQEHELIIRSTYRTLPEGYKALYLTCQSLGTAQRFNRAYALLPPRGLLVVADPYKEPVSDYEKRALAQWIARGNTVLFVSEYYPQMLGLTGTEALELPFGITITPPTSTPKSPAEAIQWGQKSDRATPIVPSFLASRAPDLVVKTSTRLTPEMLRKASLGATPLGMTPLYADSQGTVVAYAAHGQGGVIWCTSPWSFSNEGLRAGHNLEFVTTLMALQPKAPIFFDEYHHGFGAGMSVWTVAPLVTRLGIVQVGLALLLLLVTLGWRFGPMRLPAEERFTRSRAEYLTSMAGLLERMHATHVVVQRLRLRVQREVSRRLGLDAHSTFFRLREVNTQIRAFDPVLLDRVTRYLEHLDADARPDEATTLQLAVQVERLLAVKKR